MGKIEVHFVLERAAEHMYLGVGEQEEEGRSEDHQDPAAICCLELRW
jgi:hypothetical protein